MFTRTRLCAGLIAGSILLAGCASTRAATPRTSQPPAGQMTAGMVMPDGSTMGADPSSTAPASGPSAAAQMICSHETRANVGKVLALKAAPTTSSSWADRTYTCTYRLPMGELVLSVKESADPAAADAYAGSVRRALVGATALAGLTDTAFGTAGGVVVLVKDSDTLRVDASALPAEFGAQQEKRADFAYELASDILGCWTGDS